MKAITADNYHVRPFLTNKVQQYTYTFLGGSNPDQISINLAVLPPTIYEWAFDPDNDPINIDGIYQRTLYASLKHLFYSTGSALTRGQSINIPSSSILYVINLSQQTYGETIKPSSFSLTVASSSGSIVDDGNGNLYIGPSGSYIGNIFYGLGIAVIQNNSGSELNSGGLNLTTGSVVDLTFKATQTIYEHTIICTMDQGEFNYTINPSITNFSIDGVSKGVNSLASGSLTPYMTTVGLYTSHGQLVAVGKFPQAIKRVPDSQQTVIIRFDV